MNRQGMKREHGSVKRHVMEQSTLAVCRAVKFVLIILPQLIWGHFRRRAKSIERPERQLAVSHEVADEDANQIIEDIPTVSDITAPDVIEREDGSYSAQPMRLPTESICIYTAEQLETSPSTDHPLSGFEDDVPCIEPKPGSDDYLMTQSLTKKTILDPSAITPIHEDYLKESGDHTNAGGSCFLMKGAPPQGVPESIRNVRSEDTCV